MKTCQSLHPGAEGDLNNSPPTAKFLATTVLRDGEAVLARNVEDDSTLGSRDSQGEIHATSVISHRSVKTAKSSA